MKLFYVLSYYLEWHYGKAFRDYFGVWTDFLWFVYNFFSIPTLVATLFSPWKRLNEPIKKGFDIEQIFSSLIVNTIMRIVGALIRAFFFVFGLIILAVIFILGALFFVVWIILPLLIPLMIITGISMIFP